MTLPPLRHGIAWNGYLALSIRQHLMTVAAQLVREGDLLQAALAAAASPTELMAVRRQLLAFRNRYARVETTLMFFANAINTRTNPKISGYLKVCDILAYRSMAPVLGHQWPGRDAWFAGNPPQHDIAVPRPEPGRGGRDPPALRTAPAPSRRRYAPGLPVERSARWWSTWSRAPRLRSCKP
jgi:hypothetical protein